MEITAPPSSKMHQQTKDEHHMLSKSDNPVVMKQILATHAGDAQEVEVRPLLHFVEEILRQSTTIGIDGIVHAPHANMEALENKTKQAGFISILEALAYVIQKISRQISLKCSGEGEAEATTVALFSTVSSYSWDAKMVLALAAFAVNYGKFRLLTELYHTIHPLAESVALLKQLPDIVEHSNSLKPRFDALNNLINAMLETTKCIVQLKELPRQYLSPDTPPMSVAWSHIPTAAYWTIRSVVECTSLIISLIGLGHDPKSRTIEAWDLAGLTQEVTSLHDHLTKQLALCYQHMEKRRREEVHQTLKCLFEEAQVDNVQILKALIYTKDDLLPLVDASANKTRVGLEELRSKTVMLFISDLDITPDELSILKKVYDKSLDGQPDRPYEVVWLPVVDASMVWIDAEQEIFNCLQSWMPWYSLYQPSLLDPAVIEYIKEVWYFKKKPILVVLDPQGRMVHRNALDMIFIWGSLAFPITEKKEEELWSLEAWEIKFLVYGIDPLIERWINEGKLVCLYGGPDIDWIKNFTLAMQQMAQEAGISLEMVYVRKKDFNEPVHDNIATVITREKLSHYWQDLALTCLFWDRLESMWYSRVRCVGNVSAEDNILSEIKGMLGFKNSKDGWAIIGNGAKKETAKASGKKFLDTLRYFEGWKSALESTTLMPALIDALARDEHCFHLTLPTTPWNIHESITCPECGLPMEDYFLYDAVTIKHHPVPPSPTKS